jgi:ADP-ribose pyrophosphatase
MSHRKIPETAKKVFTGEIFDVYQWEQEMYDGSNKTFEHIKRADTVIVIPVTEDGKIIICEQEQPDRDPYLSMISGRVDPGEEPLEAAKRELLEETGYEASEITLFDEYHPHIKLGWTVYTYLAKGCKKVAEQNLDGGEKIELKFVSFDELIELLASKQLPDIHLTVKTLEAKLYPQKMNELKKFLLD